MHADTTIATQESRVRRKAGRNGYRVLKSRARNLHHENQGKYLLIDDRAAPVLGTWYDADLEEIEAFLND